MNAGRQVVVIARVLLPAGRDRLAERFELLEGGLEATREDLLSMVPGANAIVPDPSVPFDTEILDAAGDQLQVVANFAVGIDNIDLDACRARGTGEAGTQRPTGASRSGVRRSGSSGWAGSAPATPGSPKASARRSSIRASHRSRRRRANSAPGGWSSASCSRPQTWSASTRPPLRRPRD